MLAISVFEALRDAIGATHSGHASIRLDTPATPERVLGALNGVRSPFHP
jgi:xanthine dehydrogenase large subunit